jgi:hypothetical protein
LAFVFATWVSSRFLPHPCTVKSFFCNDIRGNAQGFARNSKFLWRNSRIKLSSSVHESEKSKHFRQNA